MPANMAATAGSRNGPNACELRPKLSPACSSKATDDAVTGRSLRRAKTGFVGPSPTLHASE